jgi:hypothetical protein
MSEFQAPPEYPSTGQPPVNLPRRVWELPLAILLWTYIGLGILFFLLLLGGGLAGITAG